jgi:hypothetical protein
VFAKACFKSQKLYYFVRFFAVRSCLLPSSQSQSWTTTPCRLPTTACSIYAARGLCDQLDSVLSVHIPKEVTTSIRKQLNTGQAAWSGNDSNVYSSSFLFQFLSVYHLSWVFSESSQSPRQIRRSTKRQLPLQSFPVHQFIHSTLCNVCSHIAS